MIRYLDQKKEIFLISYIKANGKILRPTDFLFALERSNFIKSSYKEICLFKGV